jgi:hypothetical protein
MFVRLRRKRTGKWLDNARVIGSDVRIPWLVMADKIALIAASISTFSR